MSNRILRVLVYIILIPFMAFWSMIWMISFPIGFLFYSIVDCLHWIKDNVHFSKETEHKILDWGFEYPEKIKNKILKIKN